MKDKRKNNLSGEIATILYVEDNLSDIELAEKAFRSVADDLRLRVHSINCGEDAITYFRAPSTAAGQQPPVFILLDFNLPKMNALGIIPTIKNLPAFSKIPIVILSSLISPEHRRAIYASGVDLVLPKPGDFEG